MQKVIKKYSHAVIAADVVIFTIQQHELKVLLIQMKNPPYQDCWAAPGGLVKGSESVETAACRILVEKTGVKDVYLEQLYKFGEVDRDPFGRVVSVAHMALIPSKGVALATTQEYGDVAWFSLKKLPKLAYDHADMIALAVKRLQAKLGYTNVVYGILPQQFTLTDMQESYEAILGKKLDKRNFRKKTLSFGMLKNTRKKVKGRANRPAELYEFLTKKPNSFSILKM